MPESVNLQRVQEAIADFDGKHVACLREVGQASLGEDVIEFLVGLAESGDGRSEQAATWLIKAQIESGQRLSGDLSERLLRAAPGFQHWEASLHACQILSHLEISPGTASALVPWLVELSKSERNIVRAWAYSGLQHISMRHLFLEGEIESTLAQGFADPAPSVRARLRNIDRR